MIMFNKINQMNFSVLGIAISVVLIGCTSSDKEFTEYSPSCEDLRIAEKNAVQSRLHSYAALWE